MNDIVAGMITPMFDEMMIVIIDIGMMIVIS